MRCPECHSESLMGAEYCVRCGASLTAKGEAGGLTAAADGLPELKRQLKDMGLRLSLVEGRVMVISERLGLDKSPSQAAPATAASRMAEEPRAESAAPAADIAATAPSAQLLAALASCGGEPTTEGAAQAGSAAGSADPARVTAIPREAVGKTEPEAAAPVMAVLPEAVAPVTASATARAGGDPAAFPPPKGPPEPRQPSQLARKMREWEQALPGNWLSRIGMLALFIGLGFLAKLAYDRGWVGPVPQLLAGLGCGALFLLAGHHWRQIYRGWAQALTGGGIGILYLSVFGSYGLHHLMPFWATFLLMFLVTLLAVGIALRRDSMSIAILGIVAAFLVPITLGAVDQSGDAAKGGGGSNTGLMAAYVLTLDVAVVGLASRRNWRWFTLLGFGGSMAVFGLWYGTSDRGSVVGAAEGLLTGIFLCFAAATTLFHGLRTHRPRLTDLALMTLNAAVYFGVTHCILWGDYRGWLGMIGFGLAAFYTVMGYLFLRRSRENGLLSAFAFGIAIVFLTVAIPVQLEKSWMTAAWAAEGAVLIWLAVRYGTPRWQLWGLGALGLAVIRLFAFDQFVDWTHGFTPVMNDMFWAFAPTALAMAAAAWFLRNREKALHAWLTPVLVLSAHFLAVWLASFEIIHFAGSRIWAAHGHTGGYDARSVENARNLSLVALWGIYGLALVYSGTRKGRGWLRPAGYVLACVALATTLVVLSYPHAGISGERSMPIINYSFGALAICVCVLGLMAFWYRRYAERLTESEKGSFPVLVSAAGILAVYALSAEVLTFITDPLNVRNLVLVALWAACGLGVMIAGLRSGWAWLRAQGWLLVAMAIGATMIALNYGHFLMEKGPAHPIGNYSFAAFAICIGALAALAGMVSRLPGRYGPGERALFPPLVLLANFLALWAVSSEVLSFMPGPENSRNLVLVAIWAGWGLALLRSGAWKSWGWLRAAGYAMAVVAVGATLTLLNHWTAGIERGRDWPVLNYSFGAFAACVLASYLFAWLAARTASEARGFDRAAGFLALAAASVLTIVALSAEVITFTADINVRNLVLVTVWCGYGCLAMAAGSLKGAPAARFAAYALVAAAVAMTMTMLNHGRPGLHASESQPVINLAFGGCLVCVVALYLLAMVMARSAGRLLEGEKGMLTAIIAAANALSLFALSSEVWTYAGGEQGKNMGLTVLWAAYGLAMMVAGIIGRWPWVRLGGLGLVSVAIMKLFLYDMVKLGGGYRVAAFVITGVLLLAGGLVYHRYAAVIKGFILDRPEKGASPARK